MPGAKPKAPVCVTENRQVAELRGPDQTSGVVVVVGDLEITGQDRAEHLEHAVLDPPGQVGLVVGPGGELLPKDDRVRVVAVAVGLDRLAALEGPGVDQRLGQDAEQLGPLPLLTGEHDVDGLGHGFLPSVRTRPGWTRRADQHSRSSSDPSNTGEKEKSPGRQ